MNKNELETSMSDQEQLKLANEHIRALYDLVYLYGACIQYASVSPKFMTAIVETRQVLAGIEQRAKDAGVFKTFYQEY